LCVCFLRFCLLLLASAIPVGFFLSLFPPTNEYQVRSLGWSQRRSVYAREMHNPGQRNQLKMKSWWHWFGAFSAHLGSCFFGLGTQHCLVGPLLRRWPLDLLPLTSWSSSKCSCQKKFKICNFLCSKSHLWISPGCLHILQPSWGLILWHSVSRLSATGG
jgi:hypothetical protein